MHAGTLSLYYNVGIQVYIVCLCREYFTVFSCKNIEMR